ncbi:hypothetical protein BC941DRAFT_498852 [Chlamydoabsidia padenii]|nr:hypothetical protein BC941DRAFT_498852 [Chlamydoabsidia padenii]
MDAHHRERETIINIPFKKPTVGTTNEDGDDDPLSLLQQVMSHQCEFKYRQNRLPGRHALPQSENADIDCQFYIQKGFMTTPLAYLLGQQTSHGKLHSLWIKIELETKNPEEVAQSFHIQDDHDGVLSDTNQSMALCLDRVFSVLFCHHLGARYPLIFSQGYVDKLTSCTKHIPILARSLQRMMITSEVATRNMFKDKANDYLEMIRMKIKTFQTNNRQQRQDHGIDDPGHNEIWSDLVIALYYSTKRSESLRQYRSVIKTKQPTAETSTSLSSTATDPSTDDLLHMPNASQAIQDLWSNN